MEVGNLKEQVQVLQKRILELEQSEPEQDEVNFILRRNVSEMESRLEKDNHGLIS